MKLLQVDGDNNYISSMRQRWAIEDEIFQSRQNSMMEEINMYRQLANDATLSQNVRTEAEANAARIERQLQIESTEHTIEQNKRKSESYQNYVSLMQGSFEGISNILGDVQSAWETSIRSQIDAGEISQEEGERQLEEMRELQTAIALINTFSAAIGAYNSVVSTPFIGPVLAPIAAAAALAAGYAQVNAIKGTKKGSAGSNGSNGNSVRYAEVAPVISDYQPQAVQNLTGAQETESLANALSRQNIFVSVTEIDNAQVKVTQRNRETSF
jgi:hypothetical protein